tara:strand:+ start:1194 stop:2894 length:1701 start_codon:yes stop_codon:yes gene_type:complete
MLKDPIYIIITGGVLSGLGKGVVSASIGSIFTMMGLKINIKKLDPYLNVDPGTLNPIEHGEVFVTEDGAETDLDLGYYERFTDIVTTKLNSTSSGKMFKNLLEKERNGKFLGKTVQMIPHFTNEIKDFIRKDSENYDIVICEIGGSIGDIEAMPFYEALRQLRCELDSSHFLLVHLTYIVYFEATKEFKTKPAQNAIRELMKTGLSPDVLVCRHEGRLPISTINKLKEYCKYIIDIPNVETIYKIPLMFIQQNIHIFFVKNLDITDEIILDTEKWSRVEKSIIETGNSSKTIVIGIIGKYVELEDAYCSLLESIYHASIHIKCKIKYEWVDCRSLEKELQLISEKSRYSFVCSKLSNMNAIIIPGGFGITGIEGMIECVHVARKLNIPTLGICLGLQVMVVEWLRNVCDIGDATSEEWTQISESLNTKVIGLLKDQNINLLGGTMNLGSYDISLLNNSKIYNIYGKEEIIKERHRHRYEVLPEYIDILNKSGLIVSGDRNGIVETIELQDRVHKWYIGCQYHPEYKSSIFHPHPLIMNWLLSSKSVLDTSNDITVIGNGRYPIHSF